MPLSQQERRSLQALLKKANDEQQLGDVLASQGLQLPLMPSQAMGAMTDASKRRHDDVASMVGSEFEMIGNGADLDVDPTDLAEQIAASSGPYNGPMPSTAMAAVRTPMPASAVVALETPVPQEEEEELQLDPNVFPYQRGFAPVPQGADAVAHLEAIDAQVPLPPTMKSTYHWGQVKIDMKKYKAYNYTFEQAVAICLSGDCEMRKYLQWIQKTYTGHYMKYGATSQAPDLAGYMKRIQLVIPDVDRFYHRRFD